MSRIAAGPDPLTELCFWYVQSNVHEFHEEHLSHLPPSIRTKLLLCLPTTDVWRYERTRFVDGLEMDPVWKTLGDDRLGMLIAYPPPITLCYTYRPNYRDIFFAYVWKALCDIADCEGLFEEAVDKALFQVPRTCLVKHGMGRLSNRYHEGCFSGAASYATNPSIDRGVSYVKRMVNMMASICVRPGMLHVNNWSVINSLMTSNSSSFVLLFSEVEALVLQFTSLNAAVGVLQNVLCDTSFISSHKTQILSLLSEKSQSASGKRSFDLVKLLCLSKKQKLTLYIETPLLFSVIDVAKLTELNLILDDMELLDTHLKQLSLLIAEICGQSVIETLRVSVNLRKQMVIEWYNLPHYAFMEHSILSYSQQKQLKALSLNGLINNDFAQVLINRFLSACCHSCQALAIGRTTQIERPSDANLSFQKNKFTDERSEMKSIELNFSGPGLMTWLLEVSGLSLRRLKIQDDIENFSAEIPPTQSLHVCHFALLLSSIYGVHQRVHSQAVGNLLSVVCRSPALTTLELTVLSSVPDETCCTILDSFSTHLVANAASTSLQQLNLQLQCDEVDDVILKRTFEALLTFTHLESMKISFHCQCAQVRHIEVLRNYLKARQKPSLFHFCSMNTYFTEQT